ncbi:hypothetical protein ACIBEJ_36655 [Nonomuraea sp. NPDC050790]|uniref:hypothetical protein n=1 Tax=Nonomuraea sp. NPDC050790 TaxID=3364371 RepID=UPI0037B85C74
MADPSLQYVTGPPTPAAASATSARDLLGFVDGTENPEGADAVICTHASPAEEPDFPGGSLVIVRKCLKDLPPRA